MIISNFSIKRPVFTLVTMFLILILGIVSLTKIPLKLIPEIKAPVAVVVTSYPGAGPKEILEKVTIPLEKSLATVPGLKNITSTSKEGANLIVLEFNWATDIDEVQSEVMQRIHQTPLPDEAEQPRYMKFDPSQLPIIQLSLRGEHDKEILQQLAEDLETEFARVEGVASITVTGSLLKNVVVSLDQNKLQEYGLSQKDVADVISANHISLPGQTVFSDDKQLTTRILSTIDSLETLKNLVVTINPLTNEEVTVQDVANVEIVKQENGTITRTNQTPSVLMNVLQKSDSNTAKVSDHFQKALQNILTKEKYDKIQADILFDQGEYIDIVISNIFQSLIIGGLLAMAILFFFLKGIVSPLIIGIAIPYSIIVTFVLMFFANFSLNIMTLGGLALGIGMLVDNSIVVIENIYRHLSMGKRPKDAARSGVKEVGSAIIASTLTTIAVFVPVVFISGIIGDLMKEFSFTIAFSLLSSLFVALTVVPMFASRLLKTPKYNAEWKRQNTRFFHTIENALKWCLKHRALLLISLILIVSLSILGLRYAGLQFLPAADEGFFTIKVRLENGAALSETEKVVEAIENELENEDEVDVYVSLVGSTQQQMAQGTVSSNVAELYVKMKPLDKRNVTVFEFADEQEQKIKNAVKMVNHTAKVSMQLQSSTGLSPNTLSFNITDDNKARLEQSVQKIIEKIEKIEGVTEVKTGLTETLEEVQIKVNRKNALSNGLVPAEIAMIVNDVTRGVTAASLTDESSQLMDVKVVYDKKDTSDLNQLKELLIRTNTGSYVKLSEVASIEIGVSPVKIQRMNQRNYIAIDVKYNSDTTLGEVTDQVNDAIEKLNLPSETSIFYSGEKELLNSAVDDLLLALTLAVVFVYIVMAAQFESFKYPFVIMFSVPLMFIGVTISLLMTHTPINVMSMIGIIVLAGIVVNNAIVIVDFINQQKEQGISSYDAIIQSVKDRTRPILMTALTTILGLVPLALGIGEGAEMNQPLGITVIGGLISSTFLTLFIIPVIYSIFDKETRYLNRKTSNK